MPITGSQPAPTFARLKVARLGATRLGYVLRSLMATIAGVPVQMRIAGLTIRDVLNLTPNTCDFVLQGTAPIVGQEIKIGLGSLDPTRLLFAGEVQTVDQVYEGGRAGNIAWHVTCQDYSLLLNRRMVRIRYDQQSATAIALDLATYAAGFTTAGIVADLPTVVGGIDYTEEYVMAALGRLATRIGGYANVDYAKDLKLFLVDVGAAPDDLVLGLRTLQNDPPITTSTDSTQIRTRVRVEGGGSAATAPVAAAYQTLPVADLSWYAPGGGTVVCGPQRVTYGGVAAGGTGALVGTTITPTNPLTVAGAVGTGIDVGDHRYRATFVTAAGETLPGPISPIFTSGSSIATPSAPAAAPAIGTGLAVGAYRYKVSDVDINGNETLPSAASVAITTGGAVPAPTGALTPTKQLGGNLSPGVYQWKVAFVDSNGNETVAGPASASVTMDDLLSAPTVAPSYSGVSTAGSVFNGTYQWAVTEVTASGETTASPRLTLTSSGNAMIQIVVPLAPAGVTSRNLYRTVAGGSQLKRVASVAGTAAVLYDDSTPDASLGVNVPTTSTTIYRSAALTAIPVSADVNIVTRRIYRTVADGATFKKAFDLANNTATTATDTIAYASLGVTELGASTALYLRATVLLPIAADTVNVAKRRIYRTAVNGSTYGKVTDVNDNTTATYTDALADGSLGAAPPAVSTALYQRAALSNIPIGPTGTTSRKVYRDNNSDGVFKLLTTLANNTTTTFADSTANASLGATAPTVDASGLVQAGDVLALTTNIPITSMTPFQAAGGWAFIGGIPIVYRGVSGNFLTDVAGGGVGALTTTVRYGAEIIAAPMLIGIPAYPAPGCILRNIPQGTPVNVLAQVDDVPAQHALAAAEGGSSDGIVEFYIQDNRLSLTTAIATGLADLELFSRPIITINYVTRDPNTRSGKSVHVDLPALNLFGDFTIQSVTIDQIGTSPGTGTFPRYTVVASSVHFSFEDALRRLPP